MDSEARLHGRFDRVFAHRRWGNLHITRLLRRAFKLNGGGFLLVGRLFYAGVGLGFKRFDPSLTVFALDEYHREDSWLVRNCSWGI